MTPDGTRFDLVVFDWDGTLVDSLANIVGAMQATIGELALPARSDAEVRAVVGLGFGEVLNQLFPDLSTRDHERVRNAYREHFLGAGHTAQLFPGVRETLTALGASGLTLGVATGKARVGLMRELEETGLAGMMAATRCADQCLSKPAPDMLLQLMDELFHEPVRTLMVGDSEYDLLMARAAGTASVGVTGGAHARDRLAALEPLAVIDSVADLPPLL